jgi:hypothetical protein
MLKRLLQLFFPTPKPCDICGKPSVGFAIEGHRKVERAKDGKPISTATFDDSWNYCREHDPCKRSAG